MLKIKEIAASSIITKSSLPDACYVINPYVGCVHSCVYCYARFMKRFTGHSEQWGTFVDVKINAPELIGAGASKLKGKSVLLSSVTDPYMPVERRYQITRKIFEKLVEHQPSLGILTKSDMVLRDIDLLKKFERCHVGLTITTLDESLRREIEPFASSVSDRIKALETLKKAGIRTYVFVGPIMPFFTDFSKIVMKTRHCADSYMFEKLNVAGTVWVSVKQWLEAKHPEMLQKYEQIYFSENDYWKKMEYEIRDFCDKEKIEYQVFFHHGK